MRQNGVSYQLFFLQFTDHVAIVGCREAMLLSDGRSDLLHLLLNVVEGGVRHAAQLLRWYIHTEGLQAIRVQLRRQLEVVIRLAQYLFAKKVVVGDELLMQLRQWLLVALDLELLEQLSDALLEERGVRQVAFQLRLRRILLPGSDPLARPRHRQLGQRLIAFFEAR